MTTNIFEAVLKGQRIRYIRVSSFDQNTDRQLDGIKIDRIFTDKTSGKDTCRPALTDLLEFAREEDVVIKLVPKHQTAFLKN